MTWSDDQHIAWTAALPGIGQSSPVVWGDRAFVTSIEGEQQETLIITCVKVADGSVLWTREFPASHQTVEASNDVSKAAPTPVVDARGLYAFFESGDLIALDHAGAVLWQRSLTKEYGPFEGDHGLGASPAQTDDAVIVLADHEGPSYLLAVDKATGKNRWKQSREPRVSWSSPIVTDGPNGQEILVSSNGVVQSFDARTGGLIWQYEGVEGNTVPSPSVTEDVVVIGTSERNWNVAIRRDNTGTVGDDRIIWRARKATSSFSSPLIHDGAVSCVNKAWRSVSISRPANSTGPRGWATHAGHRPRWPAS